MFCISFPNSSPKQLAFIFEVFSLFAQEKPDLWEQIKREGVLFSNLALPQIGKLRQYAKEKGITEEAVDEGSWRFYGINDFNNFLDFLRQDFEQTGPLTPVLQETGFCFYNLNRAQVNELKDYLNARDIQGAQLTIDGEIQPKPPTQTPPPGGTPTPTHTVSGLIFFDDGTPADGLTVRLIHRGFGGSPQTLSTTDIEVPETGQYSFSYTPVSPQTNLEILAVGQDPSNTSEKTLSLCQPISVDGPDTELNLITPIGITKNRAGEDVAIKTKDLGDSEFKRLTTALEASQILPNIEAIKDAKESLEQPDLSQLHKSTEWDARLIGLTAKAYKNVAEDNILKDSGIDEQTLYGLYRAGLPFDNNQLALLAPEVIENTLQQVKEAKIIDASFDIVGATDAFKKFSDKKRLDLIAPGTLSNVNSLIASSSSGLSDQIVPNTSETEQQLFGKLLLESNGDSKQLWQKVDKQLPGKAQKLQLQGKLAYLTANNLPLLENLEGTGYLPNANLSDLVESEFYTPKVWDNYLDALAKDNPSDADPNLDTLSGLIPPGYIAAYQENQNLSLSEIVKAARTAYSEDLAAKLSFSYPTQTIRQRIAKGELTVVDELKDAVIQTLDNLAKEDYELGRTSLSELLEDPKKQANLQQGIAPDEFQEAISVIRQKHSLYQITPNDNALRVLDNKGFTSAHDIVDFSFERFKARIKADDTSSSIASSASQTLTPAPQPQAITQLSGTSPTQQPKSLNDLEIDQIYRKAQQVVSVTQSIVTTIQTLDNTPLINALSGSTTRRESTKADLLKKFPSLETLFGSLDYCECEHCRSVLSPAAYLVDLFQFLDPKQDVWEDFTINWQTRHKVPYPYRNTEEQSQNPNISAVTPFQALTQIRRPDLPHIQLTCDNTNTSLPYIDLVNEIFEYYVANNKLSEQAVHNMQGESSNDLLAEPQHVIAQAYQKLAHTKYPLTLPFDLWLETIRQFFSHFELPFAEVLETLRTKEALFEPTQPEKGSDRAGVYAEYLGISPGEYAIFTNIDVSNWLDLYGDNLQTAAQPAQATSTRASKLGLLEGLGITEQLYSELKASGRLEPQPQMSPAIYEISTLLLSLQSARGLSQRLGITYKELVELLNTKFINPQLQALAAFKRLHLDPQDISQAQQESPFNINVPQTLTAQLAPAFHVPVQLDFSTLLTQVQPSTLLNQVLVLNSPEVGCSFDQTTLQYANGASADAKAFCKINLFVRLWKKLGWSMADLDRALVTFASIPIDQLTPKNLGEFFQTVLVYLAHFQKLSEKLELAERDHQSLLTLWGDIPTHGEDSLYAQLFLKPGISKQTEIFKPSIQGKYLDNTGAKLQPFLLQLQGAIGLSAEEVQAILADRQIGQIATATDTDLDLKAVSRLYRYRMLANALNLSVQELISLKSLSGLDPFKTIHSQTLTDQSDDHPKNQTLKFVEIAQLVAASGFTIDDLVYLLQHQDPTGVREPDLNDLFTLIKTLSGEISRIHSELASPKDGEILTNEQLQQKLGLILPANSDKDLASQDKDLVSQAIAHMERQGNPKSLEKVRGYLQIRELSPGLITGFLTQQEFDQIFVNPIDDSNKVQQQQDNRKDLAEKLIPYLQQQLTRQAVVQVVAAGIEVDASLIETLLSDPTLLLLKNDVLQDEPLLSTLISADQQGVSVTYYNTDTEGKRVSPVLEDIHEAANTIQRPQGAEIYQNAEFKGYLEVPATGVYRFHITLSRVTAPIQPVVSLQFVHESRPTIKPLSQPMLQPDGNGKVMLTEAISLKAGQPYEFVFTANNLVGISCELTVEGPNLPKDSLSQLTLYPVTTVKKIQQGHTLLTKALQIISSFNLSEREIRYFNQPISTPLTQLTPLTWKHLFSEDLATAQTLFKGFHRLIRYHQLKQELNFESDSLIDIFQKGSLTEKQALIASLTRRPVSDVEAVSDHLAFTDTSLGHEEDFWQLWQILKVMTKLGVPLDAIVSWTAIVSRKAILADPTEAQKQAESRQAIAEDIRNTLKARYNPTDWQRVAQAIFDPLRQNKRDALVAYILHRHPEGFERQEQLFEYFLIDPGMEPVVLTSRIKLAISSVQLFIQRCFLNLEKEVKPTALDSKHWEWMKRYRLWEANRKIFLYPENWLEPEFRNEKSHLFEELESALLQGDVSNELAEKAFSTYLIKLESIARLEIVTMYVEENPTTPSSTVVHVIGKSPTEASKYFYRRLINHAWTPWEPISANIEGKHITAITWKGRLHVFWLSFLTKSNSAPRPGKAKEEPLANRKLSDLSKSLNENMEYTLEVRLNWSEYYQGQWKPAESSGIDNVLSCSMRRKPNESNISVSSKKVYEDEQEIILISVRGQGFNNPTSNSSKKATNLEPTAFVLRSKNDLPTLERSTVAERLPFQGIDRINRNINGWMGESADGLNIEYKYYTRDKKQPEKIVLEEEKQSILHENFQDESKFFLLLNSDLSIYRQFEYSALVAPFFYSSKKRTFFVKPTVFDKEMKYYRDYGLAPGVKAKIPQAEVDTSITVIPQAKKTLKNAKLLNEFRDSVHPRAKFSMNIPEDTTINLNTGIDFGPDIGGVVLEEGGIFQSPLVNTFDAEVLDFSIPSLTILNGLGEKLTIADSATLNRQVLSDEI